MSTLLIWREKLQKIYAVYSVYILKGLQFVMGLILFLLINSNIGFMKTASSFFFTIGFAVICTFLPVTVMVMAATVLVIVHFYTLSLPIAVIAAVIFAIMYIFYFRFTPNKAWLILLSAMAFALKVPFVIPVIFGLLGTPVWIVPAACGIFAYYMADFVKSSAAALKSTDAEGMAANLTGLAKQIIGGTEMWLMMIAVVIGILTVNLIRARAVNHAWKIASAAGVVVCVIASGAGSIVLKCDLSYGSIVISAVLGAALGVVLEFLFFCVDYSQTENIQFEDDEYYYYVKAIPKVGVSAPEKRVKHITDETVNPAQNTDDILLTRSLSKELGLEEERDK